MYNIMIVNNHKAKRIGTTKYITKAQERTKALNNAGVRAYYIKKGNK